MLIVSLHPKGVYSLPASECLNGDYLVRPYTPAHTETDTDTCSDTHTHLLSSSPSLIEEPRLAALRGFQKPGLSAEHQTGRLSPGNMETHEFMKHKNALFTPLTPYTVHQQSLNSRLVQSILNINYISYHSAKDVIESWM